MFASFRARPRPEERIQRLLEAMRTLRNHPALSPEQRRRGVSALEAAYRRELDRRRP